MENSSETSTFIDKTVNTVSGLFQQPDRVINTFVEESGGRFLNPWLYLLLTALLLATVVSFTVSYPEISVTGAAPEQLEDSGGGDLNGFRMAEFQEVMVITGLQMNTQYLGFLNILMVPVMALASMIFFRESFPGYYRHLILNAYAIGQVNLAILLLIPVWMLYNEQLHQPEIYLYPATFLVGLILLITYNRYLILETFNDWLRAFSALIAGYFFYSLISGFVVAFIAFIVYMTLAIFT